MPDAPWLSGANLARLSCYLGWLAFMSGIFLPVLNVPTGDPDFGRLLFLSGAGAWEDAGAMTDSLPVKGHVIGFVVMSSALFRVAPFNPAWWLIAGAGLTLMCAALAPALVRLVSLRLRKLVGLLLVASGILMLTALFLDAPAAWAAPGYYLWLLGFVLMSWPFLSLGGIRRPDDARPGPNNLGDTP